jgi:hypothetical protein
MSHLAKGKGGRHRLPDVFTEENDATLAAYEEKVVDLGAELAAANAPGSTVTAEAKEDLKRQLVNAKKNVRVWRNKRDPVKLAAFREKQRGEQKK